eukprot:5878968-Pleurochrysis_carterae.AAC.2
MASCIHSCLLPCLPPIALTSPTPRTNCPFKSLTSRTPFSITRNKIGMRSTSHLSPEPNCEPQANPSELAAPIASQS